MGLLKKAASDDTDRFSAHAEAGTTGSAGNGTPSSAGDGTPSSAGNGTASSAGTSGHAAVRITGCAEGAFPETGGEKNTGLLALAERHSDSEEYPLDRKLFEAVSLARKRFGGIAGFVLKTGSKAESIASLLSGFASVTELGQACLLLYPPSLDGELLSHRLSASGEGAALFVFSAETPGEAVSLLKPYL